MQVALVLAAWAANARAGCDGLALDAAVEGAQVSFAEMDASGFETLAGRMERELGCQVRELTPERAGGVHLVKGLAAFLDEDDATTLRAFQSALVSSPSLSLSTALAPEGHPLRQQFDTASTLPEGPSTSLPQPLEGSVYVDGLPAREAPLLRPYILQHVRRDGTVATTAYVQAGGELPDYPVRDSAFRRRRALRISGVALGAASALAYGGAIASRSAYNEAVSTGMEARILRTHRTTNALTAVGLGGLLAGAGLVGVSFAL